MATTSLALKTLLPQSGNPRPLLGQGARHTGVSSQPETKLGRQLGPVTQAIRACRDAGPADQAIAAIQEGLDRFFAETGIPVTAAELRRRIEDRIEADLELLEALDGDPEAEPSLGATEALALCGPAAADLKASQRHDWDDQTYWGRSSATDGERDAGEEAEEENEHGGDIQDEPHDPQPDDITRWMHGYDPRVADGARAALRQVQAIRGRKIREARL